MNIPPYIDTNHKLDISTNIGQQMSTYQNMYAITWIFEL